MAAKKRPKRRPIVVGRKPNFALYFPVTKRAAKVPR